jgi:hypothetical protein
VRSDVSAANALPAPIVLRRPPFFNDFRALFPQKQEVMVGQSERRTEEIFGTDR